MVTVPPYIKQPPPVNNHHSPSLTRMFVSFSLFTHPLPIPFPIFAHGTRCRRAKDGGGIQHRKRERKKKEGAQMENQKEHKLAHVVGETFFFVFMVVACCRRSQHIFFFVLLLPFTAVLFCIVCWVWNLFFLLFTGNAFEILFFTQTPTA